jgi:hypothetical protein
MDKKFLADFPDNIHINNNELSLSLRFLRSASASKMHFSTLISPKPKHPQGARASGAWG